MKSYKVQNLSNSTTSSDQTKLISALRGVAGVETATLRLQDHAFEIKAKDKHEPKREELAAATLKAGFPLQAQV